MEHVEITQRKLDEITAKMDEARLHFDAALDAFKIELELMQTLLDQHHSGLLERSRENERFTKTAVSGKASQAQPRSSGESTASDLARRKRNKNELRVRDCMTADPFTVGPDDSLACAIDLLRRRDIRSVPVLENGKLVGVVSDRDLRQVAPSYPLFRDEDEIRRYNENLKVSAAMTADPMTISPDAPLVDAAKLLETYRISSLPVASGETLVGIISVTDLLKAFMAQNEEPSEENLGNHGCRRYPKLA